MRNHVFWGQVLYSLCAFPFAVFKLPVLGAVLTHARATGYDRRGACVPFKLLQPPKKRE